MPGQRSQDLERQVYENGLIYITKSESILKNEIITKDVYPYVCDNINSKVDFTTSWPRTEIANCWP